MLPKTKEIIAIVLLLLITLCSIRPVFAQEQEGLPIEIDHYIDTGPLVDTIPREGRELLEEMGVGSATPEELLSLNPQEFMSVLLREFVSTLRAPLKLLSTLLGVILLLLLLEGLKETSISSALNGVFSVVPVLCVCAFAAPAALDCIAQATKTIQTAANFLLALIPVMGGILLASGRSATAVSYNTFMFMGCEVAAQLLASVFIPIVGILLAMGIVSAVSPSIPLSGVANALKKGSSWVLGLLLTVFIGIMALQTSVSAAADTAATKSAKYLLGSFIPVIGSAVSDAVMAARGCIDLVKTSVGGFGILAAAIIFLPALLKAVAWYVVLTLGMFVCELLESRQLRSLLGSFSAAFGMLISIMASFLVMAVSCTALILSLGGAG